MMDFDIYSYVQKYATCVAQTCKTAEDYTKENVSKHNKAMLNLDTLRKNANIKKEFAKRAYIILLNDRDFYVRKFAAIDCLTLNIHIGLSIKILKHIERYGDRMSSMEAKRALLIWEGKLDNNNPF